MTLEPDPAFPRTAHATGPDMILAQQIVDSPEVLGVYAACEWDELHDDGKEWLAIIVRVAQAQAVAAKEAEVYNRAIEDAARVVAREHLEGPEPVDKSDEAYDLAIKHAVDAIRAIPKAVG